MHVLSHWRRGLVVGALTALTAAAALVAPATASARPAATTTTTTVTSGSHVGPSGKQHNVWEW